jgi:membrane associated rhomboid family serine protease
MFAAGEHSSNPRAETAVILLFPYRTDAPIYHFPYVTIGLIVVNALAFLALLGSSDARMSHYILEYGEGLKPHQWITSNFVHGGLLHLVGNMVALWAFGLLVEGKVGPFVFLPMYLGIGFVQCGVEQAIMHNSGGSGSFGASAIIFGLMAISLVWSPKNEVSVGGLIIIRPIHFDAPIIAFAGCMFLWEIVMIWLVGFTVSTAMLHMSGAIIGLVVGIAFFKLGWVDCEGWDLFAVMAGEEGTDRSTQKQTTPRKKKKKSKSV